MGRAGSEGSESQFMDRSGVAADLPWWEVYLDEDEAPVVLQAESAEAAERIALTGSSAAEALEVNPTANPEKLEAEVASAVREASEDLLSLLSSDAASLGEGAHFSELIELPNVLPACFSRHYTPELLAQFQETLEVTAENLSTFPDTYLASTAEELAAHALLDRAEEGLREKANDDESADPSLIAAALDRIETMREAAFEDWDVLMLFDSHLDGFESDAALSQKMGFTNLHPRDWFTPFRSDES
jgi:hypothetical protein